VPLPALPQLPTEVPLLLTATAIRQVKVGFVPLQVTLDTMEFPLSDTGTSSTTLVALLPTVCVHVTLLALAGSCHKTAPECVMLTECCNALTSNPATQNLDPVMQTCHGDDNSHMSADFCETERDNMLSALPPELTRPPECGVGN